VAIFVFLLVVFIIRKKQDLASRAAFYEKQGIAIAEGATDFIGSVGILSLPDDYMTEERVKTSTFRSVSEYGFDQMAKKEKGLERFDGGNYPVVATGLFLKLAIFVSDPEVVRDLMTTKNKYIDKDSF
jgi:hypothetical protein